MKSLRVLTLLISATTLLGAGCSLKPEEKPIPTEPPVPNALYDTPATDAPSARY